MNTLLTVLGVTTPPANNDGRRLHYIKALERLLLVSTAGAFFFSLARNVPVHAQEFRLPPDWPYTLDRALRYLSLTWFLAYFFVSSVSEDQSDKARRLKDILFDIGQSVAVLSATYGLGFVLPDRGFGFNDGLDAFRFSSAVVVAICVASLIWFRTDDPRELNRVRIAGLVVGLLATLVAWCATRGTGALLALVALQLLLWFMWWAYFRVRLDQ